MLATLTAVLLMASIQTAAAPQDGPIVTANRAETMETERMREAVAYANPLPPGAPQDDYPLVAWCEALVSGHVATGETLTDPDELDREIMRLGRLEAADFRGALAAAESRATPAMKEAAERAGKAARDKWAPVLANTDESARSQVFGLFYGLPGRCEHAARRIRSNIQIPPVSLTDAGLEP